MKKMVFTKTHLFFIRITGDIVSIWILITYLSVLKYRIEKLEVDSGFERGDKDIEKERFRPKGLHG